MKKLLRKVFVPIFLSVICGSICGKLVYEIYDTNIKDEINGKKISGILAENEIGIFAISTFNTDYILTKAENFQRAIDVLADEGYVIVD